MMAGHRPAKAAALGTLPFARQAGCSPKNLDAFVLAFW